MGKFQKVDADNPPLDRWRADEVLEPDCDLWTLKAIAECLGVSVETARRWANDPDCDAPITKPMGRWFARKRALLAWRLRR